MFSRFCKSMTTKTIDQAMMPGMKTQLTALTNAEAQRTQSQAEKGIHDLLRVSPRPRRLCVKLPLASLLLCVFALMPLGLCGATNDLTSALQKGLFEEEANRNLDAAISNYQSLAEQFDQDRQVAATAIFRLGECYRKLGRTNDAVVQYQRIIREFSDQTTLATLSRQNLAGLSPAAQPHFQDRLVATIKRGPPEATALTATDSAARATEMEAEAASLKVQIEQLSSLNREDARVAVQQNFPNPVLTKLMQDSTDAEQKLAGLTNDYAPQDMHVVRATALVNTINGQIDAQVDGAIKGLQSKMQADLDAAKALRTQSVSTSSARPAAVVTDEEEQEIRRLQAMIQNSPDLINAPGEDNPLFQAAGKGQRRVAEFLLNRGADVNSQNARSQTPLHIAAENARNAMVELLLARGASVDARDNAGWTPLYNVAGRGFKAVAETLLAHQADANAKANDGRTPLHRAADSGGLALAELLLAHGAKVNATDNDGHTALMVAAMNLHNAAVVQALLAAKADPAPLDESGRTALSYAVGKGEVESVKALLVAKADPNGGKLDVPLLVAINQKDAVSVELLLENGANPNAKGTIDWTVTYRGMQYNEHTYPQPSVTPLWLAVDMKRLSLVQLLLKYKADPNDSLTDGHPVLFNALSETNILEALLDAGGKTDVLDGSWPLLNSAVWRGNPSVVQALLKHGASADVRVQSGGGEQSGYTPLHLAASKAADRKIFELLLDNRADPNMRSDGGQTPLDLLKRTLSGSADAKKLGELADLLRRHGAVDNLPKWDRIEVSRPAANVSRTIFHKTTNDWNQFTLLELFAVQYQFLAEDRGGGRRNRDRIDSLAMNMHGLYDLVFPDLAHVHIHRPGADLKHWQDQPVDLQFILSSGDGTKDVSLKWGDVVEIPETDHPLNDSWRGFSHAELTNLTQCLTRQVQIVIKGQATSITLAPEIDSNNYVVTRMPFWIKPVLHKSNLLLASSDLSRVKVTRRDTKTGKKQVWTLDCSGNNAPDLWLRDGDVIEVPEK
jgi:ankyrin repeat protein